MTTTLILDADLARDLKELAHRERKSFKETVNEVLRAGIESRSRLGRTSRRFRVRARHCGFAPGIDVGRLNQLVDELDVDETIAGARREPP